MLKIFLTMFMSVLCLGVRAQTLAELMGKSQAKGSQWTVSGRYRLRTETLRAFRKMQIAAMNDSVELFIVSAYRSFDDQKRIWERKWYDHSRDSMSSFERSVDIMLYSSMPGTSRHHWGTDIDINSVEESYFETRKGRRVHDWLVVNAGRFGFFSPYPKFGIPWSWQFAQPVERKVDRYCLERLKSTWMGYQYEPWHWSYAPLSKKYLTKYLQLFTDDDITGFAGAQTAVELGVIDGWVRLSGDYFLDDTIDEKTNSNF